MAGSRRKASAAEAAHDKEVRALARSAAEQARLAEAAAEAAPDAQQIQAAQQAQEARAIVIDTRGYSPATDPGNPAFDPAAWKAAVDEMGGAEAMGDAVKKAMAKPAEAARDYMSMTAGQIRQLPQAEQDMVWRMMAERIITAPSFLEFATTAAQAWPTIKESLAQAVEAAQRTLSVVMPRLIEATQAAKTAFDTLLAGEGIEDTMQLWEMLTPYMDAEIEANPDLYDDEPLSTLIAAAARRARADGLDIPTLQAEQPQHEQLEMDLNFPTGETIKEDDPQGAEPIASRRRSEAEADGALMTIGRRLLVPSDPEYQNAFVSRINSEIGIFVIDRLTDVHLRDNGLQLSFLENGISDILDANKRTGAKPLQNADTGFLRAMAKGAYMTRVHSDSMTTSFYLPAFCDELGIEGTRGKGADNRAEARKREVLDRIESMGNVWGKLPGETQWWKVFSLIGYNPATEIVTVAMPYFNQLLAAIERKQQRQLEAGRKYYIGYCDLLHSSAANERNQAAVELAARVLIGIQQRGGVPDKKLKQNKNKGISDDLCTWKISCAGLIADCPQMQEKLEAQATTGGRNKAMQRAFVTMYKILREKSDLFAYYRDVMITEVIPTTKTRTAEIIVKHRGPNPAYHRPAIVIDEQAENPDTPPA